MAITENKKSRSLVNLIGVPSLLFVMWQGSYWFLGLFTCILLLAAIELSNLARQQGGNPHTYLLSIGLLGILSTYIFSWMPSPHTWIFIIGLMSLFTEVFRGEDKPLLNIAIVNFGMIWLGLFLGSMVAIRLLPEHGFVLTISVFVSVWACDTFAFVFGTKWGKKKILPTVSPKKSWMGSIAGLVGSILFLYILFHQGFYDDWLRIHDVIALGIITGGFSQFGDFAESLLKREAKVKDTSDFLQGHGGILDRFDSLTIAAPMTWLYLQFMNLI